MSSGPDTCRTSTARGTGLYIHVPFCSSRCAYCDFLSHADLAERPLAGGDIPHPVLGAGAPRDPTFGDAYVATVLWWLAEFLANDHSGLLHDVASVYVGGGTPTCLGKRSPLLLKGVLGLLRVRPGVEVTIEANPESLSPELLEGLLEAGVTRVSLGVQSLDDGVLATLGRRHDRAAALRAMRILTESRVDVAVDTMCGVPGQTLGSWTDTLERIIAEGVAHVSVYPLSIEEGTGLHRAVTNGSMPPPEPDLAAEMMVRAESVLLPHGLTRYEIANYALPGRESVHNLGYWTARPYIGIGPSAASMVSGSGWNALPFGDTRDCGRVRFTLHDTVHRFLAEPWSRSVAEAECLTCAEVAREDVMLGMRLVSGVERRQVEEAGLEHVMESLLSDGLVEIHPCEGESSRWRTTERGWLLGNEVFGRLWTEGDSRT